MRKEFLTAAALTVVLAGSTACATKGFVRREVGATRDEINQKVDAVSQTVEQTQERTRKNEVAIAAVDKKTDEVGIWAKDAGTAAATAGTAAATARTAADDAAAKAAAVDQATKRLLYEVVLSEDQGNFAFGKTDLPDTAKTRIDELIGQLKADPKGAYVEIEGHADSTGAEMTNERLGLERAEAVKRYLYEAHKVPLHKMNVISYGEEKPVAPNNTRDGRAKNRRVVIRVLA
jgi:peptidoglycan-associated lipoprotein